MEVGFIRDVSLLTRYFNVDNAMRVQQYTSGSILYRYTWYRVLYYILLV